MMFFDAPTGDLLVVGTPSGIPAPFPAAAHLRPTAPSVPPATSVRAYCATTDTPLGQKNHQNWCLGLRSVDLCNLSLFRHYTHTTLLSKRQIRRSESRSASDRWICAISTYSGIVRALCSSPNDRSDAPSPDPKRSPLSKLPRASRRICLFANALHTPPW
jgi:hypothetical protein